MKLAFKRDFDDAARMWDSFWKGENKRPIARFVLPKEGVEQPEAPSLYMDGFDDGNFGPGLDKLVKWAGTRDYIGDAMPFYYIDFSPDTMAAYLGCDLKRSASVTETAWSVPFVKDWDDVDIKFDRSNYWWRRTIEWAEIAKSKLYGKMLIAPICLCANLDVLAAMRGIENLLIDLLECPDKIRRALKLVGDAHDEMMLEFSRLLEFDKYGSINLEGFYATGAMNRPQCDMSCMISPETFREFVAPALKREGARFSGMVYHLDGPGALQHVEALCEIDELNLITWVPGAGNTEKDWTWLYEKIYRLGKGMARHIADKEVIFDICRKRGPRGLCFSTDVSSKMEAECFIADLEKASA